MWVIIWLSKQPSCQQPKHNHINDAEICEVDILCGEAVKYRFKVEDRLKQKVG